jgi:bifunctional UDP-N-acetylglucosamine pyrophosphorylase / glucosamine-1-phosphate N-acetyltransferase
MSPISHQLHDTAAVILAAGQGTRMKSALPKIMHTIAGRPLVHYPVRAALDAGCGEVVVVVGHGREIVAAYLGKTFGARVRTAVQEQQRGTGDAARAGLEAVRTSTHVLVFYGDVPLLEADDVAKVASRLFLEEQEPRCEVALAICEVDEPFGYGRVLRDAKGNVTEIREEKDLDSPLQHAIKDINPGIYMASLAFMKEAVAALKPNNAQGELYLTDIVSIAARAGKIVAAVSFSRSRAEVMAGINDRDQLALAEIKMHARIAGALRKSGVTVRHGARIDDGVEVARDAVIESGVVLRGATKVGEGATIDVGCVLTNVTVAEGALVRPYCVMTDSIVGARAQIGPFSHLRPDSDIGEEAHVGNFVETKKTKLAKGAKANHLAYLGDGIIGEGANVGAGTIFCNYDGFQKHTTTIEAGAFIGSDSQLVAPVTIGKNAYVATGTTVTKDVPENAMAISRVRQENKAGYAEKLNARFKAAKEAAAKAKK